MPPRAIYCEAIIVIEPTFNILFNSCIFCLRLSEFASEWVAACSRGASDYTVALRNHICFVRKAVYKKNN